MLITRFVVSVGGRRVAAFSRHDPKFHIDLIAYLCFYDAQSVWECLLEAKTGAVAAIANFNQQHGMAS